MLIISLGLVALSQLYIASMWTYQKARYLSVATQRAQFEIEKVQNLGALNLLNGVDDNSYPPDIYGHDANRMGATFQEKSLPGGTGHVFWSYYPPNQDGNEHLLKVDVIMSWKSAEKTRTKVELTTLLTDSK